MTQDDLQGIREAIERVDHEILTRLAERMALVERVGEAKLAKAFPFRDPAREGEVLNRIRLAAVEHGLDPHEVERLYRHIMEMSIARQQSHIRSLETTPLRVAYQGVEGSFTHLAAQRHYADRKGGDHCQGHQKGKQKGHADGDPHLAQPDGHLISLAHHDGGKHDDRGQRRGDDGLAHVPGPPDRG